MLKVALLLHPKKRTERLIRSSTSEENVSTSRSEDGASLELTAFLERGCTHRAGAQMTSRSYHGDMRSVDTVTYIYPVQLFDDSLFHPKITVAENNVALFAPRVLPG